MSNALHILLIITLTSIVIFNLWASRFSITPRIRKYCNFMLSIFISLFIALSFWQQSQHSLFIAIFGAVVVFIATIIAVVGQKRGWIKPSKIFRTNPPSRAYIFAMFAIILSQITLLIMDIK